MTQPTDLITPVDIQPGERELALAFLIRATPAALYRCWTDPELIPLWFAPKPLTTKVISQDLRVGGYEEMVMQDPSSGAEYPANGVYLELVPDRRIVSTDAFGPNWAPTAEPFMVMDLSFEPQADGRTLYIARARHWSADKLKQHEEMGFHAGWTQCAHQLAELAAGL